METGIAAPSIWVPTTSLPRQIANFAAVSNQKRIYVIGGGLTPPVNEEESTPINEVYYAQILVDGRLSDWRPTSPLPDPLTLHTAVITNSTIYVIGGYNGENSNSLSAETFYATINKNGDLSAWTRSATKLPLKISLLTAVAKGDYIYVIGGFDTVSVTSLKSVYRAKILAGGDISSWEPLAEMGQSNYRHTSEIYNDRIYVIGGRERRGKFTRPLNSIYIGQINSESKIGSWTPTEFLPQNLYFHGSVLSRDEEKIYTFGGYDGNTATDKVYNTGINIDGSLVPWLEVSSLKLPKPLYRHSVVLADNGSVYLLGGKYNDQHINETSFIPPLSFTKSSTPPGPIHEGDTITYTIAYANTSLTSHVLTITDQIPFNAVLKPGSIQPAEQGYQEGSTIIWNLEDVPPGGSGHVSFAVRVPLLPSEPQNLMTLASPGPPPSEPPAYVLPFPIACETTHFWANGVTRQPPRPNPYTIQVQIPPDANLLSLVMWVLVKGRVTTPPTVGGVSAEQVAASQNSFGASLWSTEIEPAMIVNDQVTVVTHNPCELNAVFLFDQNDPPFDQTTLDDFDHTTKTFTYTFDLPSVATQTIQVLMPFMDITSWMDNLQPNTRLTTVTMQFNGQSHRAIANQPNLGNGLLMTHFPFNIGRLPDALVATKTLTITVDTEEFIYILAPRICRPVYIENTAWLCSDRAGCISATVRNSPPDLRYPYELFLPIIMKP